MYSYNEANSHAHDGVRQASTPGLLDGFAPRRPRWPILAPQCRARRSDKSKGLARQSQYYWQTHRQYGRTTCWAASVSSLTSPVCLSLLWLMRVMSCCVIQAPPRWPVPCRLPWVHSRKQKKKNPIFASHPQHRTTPRPPTPRSWSSSRAGSAHFLSCLRDRSRHSSLLFSLSLWAFQETERGTCSWDSRSDLD